MRNNTTEAFFALVRAGLWEEEARLSQFGKVDYEEIMCLAEEQSVLGLVTAGLEHVKDVKVPQEILLQFIGQALQIEQQNMAINDFIGKLIEKMRGAGINTLMVKGQGIAQCYERPLWRSSGDVDLFLSNDNYKKAKSFLLPLSSGNKPERLYSKELGMSIGSWYVEIHGSMRGGLSEQMDREIDAVQEIVFNNEKKRPWMNGKIQVFLPGVDEDVFFVFTHFIKHLYKEGTGLKQICDWCRLLWTYRESINYELLESRLKKSGLMTEWMVFAAIAVEYLGMPIDRMPFYNTNKRWSKRAKKLKDFILLGFSGNRHKDTFQLAMIFPWKTFRYLPSIYLNVNGLKIRERLNGKFVRV